MKKIETKMALYELNKKGESYDVVRTLKRGERKGRKDRFVFTDSGLKILLKNKI